MKVTTNDIAKAAGVSQSTVSIVLSDNRKVAISPETRSRVLKTAEEMGYRRKKTTERKSREKKSTIGLLVPTLSNLYYPFLIQSVEAYANTMGWTIVVQNTMRDQEQEEKCIQFFREIDARGVLCLYSPKTEISRVLPTVIVGERLSGVEVDTVSLNSYSAGCMIAEHLLSLGHKDIAYVTTPLCNVTDARRKRLEGIQSVMRKADILDRLVIMVDDEENETTDTTYEFDCGRRLTMKLLEKDPQCTAIIAVNDMTAWGCIEMLNSKGIKIPNEMSIGAFDNLMMDTMLTPKLTSVDQMAFHGCKIGLNVLLQKINSSAGTEEPIYMEYKPKLYVRESTGKAKKQDSASIVEAEQK